MTAQQGFSTSPNMLAQLAAQLGGTAAVPAVQRSQYLADALQNLSHAGEGIKSYGALGANLLAEVLLQYGRNKSNADLLKSIQGAQGNMLKASTSGTGLADADAAPSAPAEPAAPPAPAAAAFAAPDAPPMAPQPQPTQAPSSAKAQALAALIKGGVSPMGAAGLVGGFGQESGPDLSRNNPAEGAIGMANWEGPRGAAAQQYFAQHGGPTIDNQAAFALSELHGPEARAMTALQAAQDPQAAAAAALQFERPAGWTPHGLPQNASGWDARLAGAQELAPVAAGMAVPPPPDAQALAQGGPPASAQMPPPGMPPQGQPAPVQLAMLGGPQAMAGMAAPPPAPQGAPAAPVAPPQAPQPQQGIPTGPDATPQEIALYRQYSQFPVGSLGWSKAMEIAQTVQARHAEPIKLSPGEYFDQNGQARSVHSLQTIAGGAPNAVHQIDPVTGAHTFTADPSYGAVPANAHMDASGSVVGNRIGGAAGAASGGEEWSQPFAVPGLAGLQVRNNLSGKIESAGPTTAVVSGAFQPGTVVSQRPGEAPTVVQAPAFDPEAARAKFLGSPEYQKFNEARTSSQGFFNAIGKATKNSGMLDVAGTNAVIQAMSPGSNPRTTTNEFLLKSLGLPDELQTAWLKVLGNGIVTPESLHEMASLVTSYDESSRQAAIARMQSDTAASQAYNPASKGVPGEAVAPALVMPSFHAIEGGASAQNSGQTLQDARMAISRGAPREAVVQRLRSMGIDPGAL